MMQGRGIGRWLVRLVVAIVAVLSLVLLVDQYRFNRRPAGVPPSAIRISDKGSNWWLDCTPSVGAQPNICTVYAAKTGEVLRSSSFLLEGEKRGATREELQIAGYDGNVFLLKTGRKLVPAR